MEDIDQRIKNLEAKYSDQVQLLEKELEEFRTNVKNAEDELVEERNRHKTEEKKLKKEVHDIRHRLEKLEAYLRSTPADQINLDKIHQSLSAAEASDNSADYNDQELEDGESSPDHAHKSSKKRELPNENESHQSSAAVEQPITPETTGVFAYLYDKYQKNPVDAGLVELSGNSFDVYEQNLLPSLIDSKWDGNHWLSENVSNSHVVINFIDFSVKINKYRLRVGCSNGLGRFVSWDLEGSTIDEKKILLDKVVDCAEITREHPEVEIPIQNDTFVRSIKIMMRGKSTDRNYKMRFRNIEIFGEIKFDK